MINELLNEKSMTKYRLSKVSGVPYTTINDICSGKADIKKCSVDSIYRIAKALDKTVEEIIEPYYVYRPEFDLFKSEMCHRLKELGDIDFIIDTLESDIIIEYFEKKWYPETLYLLALLDYISKENDVPLCDKYDELRKLRLEKELYPKSVSVLSSVNDDNSVMVKAKENAIPEFLKYNIIESEIRNVV